MYRIVKVKGNLVTIAGTSDTPYFSGQIPREDWLNAVEETYLGEKSDLAEIKNVWIPIIGGSYHHVKETLESWARNRT